MAARRKKRVGKLATRRSKPAKKSVKKKASRKIPAKKSKAKKAKAKKSKSKAIAKKSKAKAIRRKIRVAPDAISYAGAIKNDELEGFLLSGEHSGLLEDYFGTAGLAEIRELARTARTRSVRGGPKVVILPGIMGSKLGIDRKIWFDDVIWFGPVDIARGNLRMLSLEGGSKKISPLGVLLLAYLKLKLRLRIKGFDASFYPYDWRQSIDQLGAQFHRHLEAISGSVSIVAHSMGGLVTRAALARSSFDQSKVSRVVMLGTPNRGSFVPVQAMRGLYGVVKKVAALDLEHDAEELADLVFNTFPGLCQMLPFRDAWNGVDLYDKSNWPARPRLRQPLLNAAPAVQAGLAKADDRFVLIAGMGQDTIVDIDSRSDGKGFEYHLSQRGDGTVPLDFAQLPDMRATYYVDESHGSLPNNRSVAFAAADILATGSTERLPTTWDRHRERVTRTATEEELAAEVYGRREGGELSQRELRHMLEELVAPDARDDIAPVVAHPALAIPDTGLPHTFSGVVVGRRLQHRISIRLLHGSIASADARAYALGIYRDVEPRGAAMALDELLDGAVREFSTRRMFSGDVGEIFNMPAGRQAVLADHVLFAGLGAFDTFDDDVQRLTAENVMRTLLLTRVEDVATVLFGTGSQHGVSKTLASMLEGFVRALLDADDSHNFRSITLCELDDERYREIKREVYRLASTDLFNEVEVTITEVEPRFRGDLVPVGVARDRAPRGPIPAYLIVRRETRDDPDRLLFRASILGAEGKATVPTFEREVSSTKLDKQLAVIERPNFDYKSLERFGTELTELVLDKSIRAALHANRHHPLVVIHDALASRIPWETLRVEGNFPAANHGLSRQYMAENLSIVKWLEERRVDPLLRVLLVINPTQDLPGAEEEGDRIAEILAGNASCRTEIVRGDEATRGLLERHFRSGEFEVVHYCGHAFFDPIEPTRSGIHCSDGVLSGSELAGMHSLPSLVFFNACESARVRKGPDKKRKRLDVPERVNRSAGLAEAFLRGGVANYVGTYWPVGDDPAKVFARKFYGAIVRGETVGDAMKKGRKAVKEIRSVDWADYIHYGSRDFRLKLTGSPEGPEGPSM